MAGSDNLLGVVAFTCGGADYEIVFTTDALCRLETRMDLSVQEIEDQLEQKPRLTLLRAMLHVALRQFHPEITELQAGEMFRQEGGGPALGAKLGEAFKWAMGKPEEGDAAGDPPAAPPKTKGASTGRRSSGSGASTKQGRRLTSGG